MEINKDNTLQDPRERNPKYNRAGFYLKLQQFEANIYRMMDDLNEEEINIEYNYLTEIADKDLYLEPAPQIYCLYDFVDEFLEEGGIAVSYKANTIQFKQFIKQILTTEIIDNLKEKSLDNNSKSNTKTSAPSVIGLLMIGWGTAIIGIARSNKVEEICKFRASQLGRYDWTRFSSKEELNWWLKKEKSEAYRNICRIASSEFQSRINELDFIIIGLKKYITKDNIELNWFGRSVQEKISKIVEFNEEIEPDLKNLLNKSSDI
jgi:hypothetical protein